jgi:hypothetical protein
MNRARAWAKSTGAPWYESCSETAPVVMFDPYMTEDGPRHGNFIDDSYAAAVADPHWANRLKKAHPKRDALPVSHRANAKELDSCTSSDALLLNVMCYPTARTHLGELLDEPGLPEFGVGGAIPLRSNLTLTADRSELDLIIRKDRGAISLIVEAKLTERGFTRKPRSVVERYASFEMVFEMDGLDQEDGYVLDYQLIRSLLAAHYHKAKFVLIHDARRSDLRKRYDSVLQAVRDRRLLVRSSVLTWQELAKGCPPALQWFLREKYGIVG